MRTSGRAHREVNYNERAAGPAGLAPGPAWLGAQQGATAGETSAGGSRGAKENARPASAGAVPPGKRAPKAQAARKSAPAVAQKGRNAGLERLPIEDVKPAPKQPAAAAKRSGAAAAPAAAGKQVLPGVFVKAPAAAAKPASRAGGSADAAPSGSSGKRKAAAAEQAAAKPAATPGGSGGKRKAVEAAPAAKPAAKLVAAPEPKRQKAPQQQQQQQRSSGAGRPAAAAAAPDAGAELPALDGDAEQLVEHFSANYRELQGEHARQQALYEDLKAAKIDEEVQQLLEQQNRHVTELCTKNAALVEHYRAEADAQVAVAAQAQALLEERDELAAEALALKQALLEREAEVVERERQLALASSRLTFLERFARVYESSDKCLQTDEPPRASASAQFPSLQSSGMEMLQAHAMVPEGAGGSTMYKQPKGGAAAPEADASYTLPAFTPLPGALAATAAAAGGAAGPVSGSDMDLTGSAAAAVQQQEQGTQAGGQQQPLQQRRRSVAPAAGRVAHAAAGGAMRPASAESQMGGWAGPGAARPQQQQQRRASLAPGAFAAPLPPAAGGSRRISAPPVPTDRELHFVSTSAEAGGLAAVPEEQPMETEQQAAAQAAAGSHAAAVPASVPAPPRELALAKLTGLSSTPLKGGIFQYTDPRFGYTFQLGPASPDSALPGEEAGEDEGPQLCYRPIALGAAERLLPDYFREELKFGEGQRNNFFHQMMDALASK